MNERGAAWTSPASQGAAAPTGPCFSPRAHPRGDGGATREGGASKAARRRAGRPSVRLRLTLLYVGLFLVSAACLLTITYFLVERQLPAPLTISNGQIAGVNGSGQPITGGTSISTACGLPQNGSLSAPAQTNPCAAAIQQ